MKKNLGTLEECLEALSKKSKEGPITVETFFTILSGKGKMLLLIFLCLPLGQIPGISIPFGLLICFLGIRLAFFKTSIWLPKWILNKQVPQFIAKNTLNQLLYGMKVIKKWVRPRPKSKGPPIWGNIRLFGQRLHKLPLIIKLPTYQRANGLLIAFIGLMLAGAPPLPVVSILAFAAILMVGLGMLNSDGLYISIGYVLGFGYCLAVILGMIFIPYKKIWNFLK